MEKWIKSIDPTQYNIEGAFSEFNSIPLRNKNSVNIGDIFYLYLSSEGYQYLGYKTEVINKFEGSSEKLWDQKYNCKLKKYKGKFIEVKIINRFDSELFTLDIISKYGIKKESLKGPQKISSKKELCEYIDNVEKKIEQENKNYILEKIKKDEEYINKIEQQIDLDETEKKIIIKGRIGQGGFRDQLLIRDKRCVICGLEQKALLVASHIKPWSSCENGTERWDVNNGLCLCSLHDALFDKGFITFDEKTGEVIYSARLSEADKRIIDIPGDLCLSMTDAMKKYMLWHNNNLYGKFVYHEKYKIGKIVNIDIDKDTVIVKFNTFEKTFMVSCLDNGILRSIF